MLAKFFDSVAQDKIRAQTIGYLLLKFLAWEGHKLQTFIHLWDHLENNANGECIKTNHAISQLFTLPNVLRERSTIVIHENDCCWVPPLVEEADSVFKVGFEFTFELEWLVFSINVRFADLDKVYQHDQVHYELDGDGNDQTPVEDWSWWLFSVELLERFIEAEHHEDDGDAQTKIGRLIVTHFHTVKVECAHCVRGE